MTDNQELLHSVFLLYAEPYDDGALIDLSLFRSVWALEGHADRVAQAQTPEKCCLHWPGSQH